MRLEKRQQSLLELFKTHKKSLKKAAERRFFFRLFSFLSHVYTYNLIFQFERFYTFIHFSKWAKISKKLFIFKNEKVHFSI